MTSLSIKPYLQLSRADRPIGSWLLLFPCWWGVAFADVGPLDIKLYLLFALGAFVMRGAGCTLNDLVDHDIDAKVTRTKQRPIASGDISVRNAIIYFAAQCIAGLWVLLQLPRTAQVIGVMSMGLVAVYPFMKRITYWPQLFLGLTFNVGVLIGWASVESMPFLHPTPWLVYLAGVFWTLGYDTIYALQDIQDDMRVGVKSTAILFGSKVRYVVDIFYGAFFVALAGAGYMLDVNPMYYGLLAIAYLFIFWQRINLDIENIEDCLAKFKANQWVGWLVLVAILAGKL